MYSYEWDIETGGILLNSSPLSFSKEPRPVYYEELDILGFGEYWEYARNATYPYMWAEANNYWYRGRKVAQTKGGSLYVAPEIIILEEPEPSGLPLRFVDIPKMVEKNWSIMESLVQVTIKKIFNTFVEYREDIDVFYVAFSGGKDSVVVLDLVQRSLPHNEFKVLFGDTRMEFPDTYAVEEKIAKWCKEQGIAFLRAQSSATTKQTWKSFGPPAVTNRWCCSVHKTSPQIMLLQNQTKSKKFTGMAFTGIRGDESVARSEYEDISLGGKHQGQFSCHPIIEWNSAELFIYIYQNNLVMNEAYKKGNSRAGCLVCPMSSGKHEYMKRECYRNEVDSYIDKIKSTSGKEDFSQNEMMKFIDEGNWKTRRSGRELNFGYDKHTVETSNGKTKIIVFVPIPRWYEWVKTIGEFIRISDEEYIIDFKEKAYRVFLKKLEHGVEYSFPNCGTAKDDIKFISLFRSVVIKSIYCVNCGVCVAECTNKCIDMTQGLKISNDCKHCYQCHEIQEHCLRYNSIRNKIGGEKKVKGLDRYYSFGVREEWLSIFFKYKGGAEFWDTDGDGKVPNKKKDAFLNFVRDADLVSINKTNGGNKYTKYEPTELVEILYKYGAESEITWAILLCNLAYTPQFNWYIKNIRQNETITPEHLKYLLNEVMEGDIKGLGKRNISDAFKIMLIKTPLGREIGLGICDYNEKESSTGNEKITLNSYYRSTWESVEPRVILYSLYKFAEECGDYYQFTLTRALNYVIDSDGISPSEIFGLDREKMEKILNGLAVNYPEFISVSFTLDLDNITLRKDKNSQEVLKLL